MQKKHKRLILLIAITALLTGFHKQKLKNDNYNNIIIYQRYVVSSGDTLWNIAKQYNTYKDIRKTVYEIRKVNNSNCIIKPGQVLLIPINNKN